jgi:hypothetical protein
MTSDRSYVLELHRSERTPRLYDARLYRMTDDAGPKLVAGVTVDDDALRIESVFAILSARLVDHQDEHGGELR